MAATNFGQNWPSSWTTDATITSLSIAAAATSAASSTIANSAASPNEVLDTEVGIAIAYGGTITGGGCIVYVCRDVDGTNFESPTNDAPFSFTMPAVASTTCRRSFTVSGADVGKFVVKINNPSGNSTVTATMTYRQSSGQYG